MFLFRLKRTWQKIQSAGKFAVLEHQMNPSSNFLSYRATLKAAISRSEGATDQRQRIVIPFFSLLVKDLLVVNEVSLIKTVAEDWDSKAPSVGQDSSNRWRLLSQFSATVLESMPKIVNAKTVRLHYALHINHNNFL